MLGTNDKRAFYQSVKEQRKGFQPGNVFCKDKDGNLIGDKAKILERWAEYFQELLEGEREDYAEFEDGSEVEQNEDIQNNERDPWEPPSEDEVRIAVENLKSNKAPGEDNIPAELWKHGGERLIQKITSLIQDIWNSEEMPAEWAVGIICPVHKKGDKTDCNNYRGITLLSTIYKVFSRILKARITPLAEQVVGEYQCGFRAGRSTQDQIFSIRQALEKCYEFNVDIHQLFIDFKQAYDSIKRLPLFKAMQSLGVQNKLIRLVRMTLQGTKSKVKVGGELSGEFEIRQGLRQGDVISTILFNLALEKAMRKVLTSGSGTIYNKMIQIMAFADDVDIIARRSSDLEESYTALRDAAKELGLVVNTEKTKYMYSSRRGNVWQNKIKIGGEDFDRVREFKYLGSLITDGNMVSEEINARITAGNRSYFALQSIFRSSKVSRSTKLIVYKSVVRPTVTYGSETWTLTRNEEEKLRRWERKILRKVYGAVCENGVWRCRTNQELRDLYDQPDIISFIKAGRVRWLGHVARMDDTRIPRKMMDGRPGGGRRRGRPRLRWLEDVEDDLRRLGVRSWRRRALDREEWRGFVLAVRVLHGL